MLHSCLSSKVKKLIITLMLFLSGYCSFAIEKEVIMTVPGKLASMLNKKEYLDITRLTITGEINDKDIKVIGKLTNLEYLNIRKTTGTFHSFPSLPKLKSLLLPIGYTDSSKGNVWVSQSISNCTSLRFLCSTSDIARRVTALPNLRKIGIYDAELDDPRHPRITGVRAEVRNIDTLIIWRELNNVKMDMPNDEYPSYDVNTVFSGYRARYIGLADSSDKYLIALNAYEPGRTDYRGINILPILSQGIRYTGEHLDLSDVIAIPPSYFQNSKMKTIKFSKYLLKVGEDAFKNCENLTTIEFPGGTGHTLHIDITCFNSCWNLKEIRFCRPVEMTSNGSFTGNRAVITFERPSNVTLWKPSSPFHHFIFKAVPLRLNIGNGDCEFRDVVSYIEVPNNSKKRVMALCSRDDKKSDYERYIYEQRPNLKTYNIKVEKPGTILSYLPVNDLENIDSLTVTGVLYETDLDIIEKCVRLSYLNLRKTFITISPERQEKERAEMQALLGLFGMLGTMAEAQYNNNEIGVVDYASAKYLASLADDANNLIDETNITEAEKKCSIPNKYFRNMSYLKTVILPYRASRIGENVFQGCVNLQRVELPPYLEVIEQYGFSGCPELHQINFPKSLYYIGGGSFAGAGVDAVDLSHCTFHPIKDNESNVWWNAFHACPNLRELKIPEGVTGISAHSYALRKVYFPKSIRNVGNLAWYHNCELHFQTVEAPKFSEPRSRSGLTIYCPKGSITSYFNALNGDLTGINIIEE